MPSIKQSLSLMSIILASLVWVPHAAVLAQEKTEDIPSNGSSDPDPDSSSRDESQTVGTANDYGHFDIELLRVRLVENEFVSIYRDAPMHANNTPSGRVSPVTSGNTAGNDIYRLKIPANQTAVFLGSGKPISIELFRQLFADNDIPVIISDDPQKLIREFSNHICLDAIILRKPNSKLDGAIKLDTVELEKIDTANICTRNEGTLTQLGAIMPDIIPEELTETQLNPVLQTTTLEYSVQVPYAEQIPYTVTVPKLNDKGEKVLIQEQQMRTVKKMRTETGTREVTKYVLQPVSVTKTVYILSYICCIHRPLFREQAYTVPVPYTEQVEQPYTVMVPQSKTYTVGGITKTRTIELPEERTRTVNITRYRNDTRTSLVWSGVTSQHIIQQRVDDIKNVRMATVDIVKMLQANAVNETAILMAECYEPEYGTLFSPNVIFVPGIFFDQTDLLANSIKNTLSASKEFKHVYLGEDNCFVQQSTGNGTLWSEYEAAKSIVHDLEEKEHTAAEYYLSNPESNREFKIPKNGGKAKIKPSNAQWEKYTELKKVGKKAISSLEARIRANTNLQSESKAALTSTALDKLRETRTYKNADKKKVLKTRLEKCIKEIKDYGYGQIIIGKVVVDEPGAPEFVTAQMNIEKDGAFVDVVKNLKTPICFRMHQFKPVDVSLDGMSGEIIDLGEIKIDKLPENQLVPLKAQLVFAEDISPEAVADAKVTLGISRDKVNTPSNGSEGRSRWPEPVTIKVEESGSMNMDGFSPARYYLKVEVPGYETFIRSVDFDKRSGADLGKIKLKKRDP